jgi:stage V sporulation protein D (sporulation-specific penicillin-binding protein)
MAMGHELSVTALQLALAYGAIANGGTLMAPQLLKAEYDANGKQVYRAEPHPLRRIVSTETAATMRGFLQAVVDSGTATRAALAWAHVGGKTGTAQKYDTALHTYHNGKYLGSFVGFLPVESPRLVCVVMVDEPKKGYYGGDVAAPVFKKIMEDLYRLRGGPLAPRPLEANVGLPRAVAVAVPGVRMLPIAQAKQVLAEAGLRARVDGGGTRVFAQVPAAGTHADKGTVVALATAPEGSGLPNVVGLTVREALTQLASVAAQAQVVGRGVVVRQEPAPGSPVVPGRACVLTCAEREDAIQPVARKS